MYNSKYNSEYNLYMKSIESIIFKLNQMKVLSEKDYSLLFEYMFSIEDLLVDAYTLSKMFRVFGNINSTKVITYAGYSHIFNYAKFFEQYLNVKLNKYESPSLNKF